LRHAVFDSGHDYNQAMREAMYGWVTRWLKEEGDGKPIPEPAVTPEKPEDLRCFPDNVRPKGFLFPPTFAAATARALVAQLAAAKPDHASDWESTAVFNREQIRKRVLGDFPKLPRPAAKLGKATPAGDVTTTPVLLEPEPGLPLPVLLQSRDPGAGRQRVC